MLQPLVLLMLYAFVHCEELILTEVWGPNGVDEGLAHEIEGRCEVRF